MFKLLIKMTKGHNRIDVIISSRRLTLLMYSCIQIHSRPTERSSFLLDLLPSHELSDAFEGIGGDSVRNVLVCADLKFGI